MPGPAVLTARVTHDEAHAFRVVARADGRTTSGLLAHLARQHVAEYLADDNEGPSADDAGPSERRGAGAHVETG